jgi:ABC-type sulfate/molybdate transport systems ATPase subunit
MAAMPLLSLVDVTLDRAQRRRRERDSVVLCDASFSVEAAEWVAIWGLRRSGRTMLLQAAAGMFSPTAGAVSFAGVDLARRPMLGAAGGIGYAFVQFADTIATSALTHVAAPLLGGRCSGADADRRAADALRRVEALHCAKRPIDDLDRADVTRVAIARALVTQPTLLLLDEPLAGIPPAHASDALRGLIESLARDDGIAVLMTTGDGAELAGVDRALTLDGGRLHGPPSATAAQIISLRRGTA